MSTDLVAAHCGAKIGFESIPRIPQVTLMGNTFAGPPLLLLNGVYDLTNIKRNKTKE